MVYRKMFSIHSVGGKLYTLRKCLLILRPLKTDVAFNTKYISWLRRHGSMEVPSYEWYNDCTQPYDLTSLVT